jgi:poly(3-hydroxybutyrate) depolymerase
MRRLILLSYINDEIDLNRVYLIGYSAGGDGVY